jgi:hypothetical protein
MRFLALVTLACFFSACSLIQPKEAKEVTRVSPIEQVSKRPLEDHELQELNTRVVDSYVYGEGLGDSVIKVGTAVVFPPFLLVMLGNAALSATGHEPVGVSTFLPEKAAEGWDRVYSEVTSAPGRVSAGVAGRDYVDSSPGKTVKNYLEEREYLAQVF